MPRRTPPRVMGHEFAGTIEALGEGVTEDGTGRPIKVGDRIGIKPGLPPANDFFSTVAYQPTVAAGRGAYGFAAASMKHLPLAVTGGYAQYVYLVPGTIV